MSSETNTQKSTSKIFLGIGLVLDLFLLTWILKVLNVGGWTFALLAPKGVIAAGQKHILVTSLLLMFALAVPFYVLAFFIVRKYRVENADGGEYKPELIGTPFNQILLWMLPIVLVCALSTILWKGAHALDPFKEIHTNVKPITIEVVALEWKWLFIYPNENLATVNFVEFPENTPINFVLTADAPMSSFWIPQLGGQMYAMTGMTTQLNLMAGERGQFRGSAAEINGEGFSGMNFVAKSVSNAEYAEWVNSTKQSQNILNIDEYKKLAHPSKDNPQAIYGSTDTNVFNYVLAQYMNPDSHMDSHMDMNSSYMK